MSSAAQPNLGLVQGYADLEDNWGDAMNANLRAIDALAQAIVIDKDLATPPGAPTAGDCYIVAASPTGAWTGHAGHIARWQAPLSPDTSPVAGWEFYVPKSGWMVWVADEATTYRYESDWLPASVVGINNQTGTTYTLSLADGGKVVRQANASAITTTVPNNSTAAFPVGITIAIRQTGAGQVTLSPAVGVAINVPDGFAAKTGRQHATIMLHKVATNEWDLTGDVGV